MTKTTTISREDADDTIDSLYSVINDWAAYKAEFAPPDHHKGIDSIIAQTEKMIEAFKGDSIVIEG